MSLSLSLSLSHCHYSYLSLPLSLLLFTIESLVRIVSIITCRFTSAVNHNCTQILDMIVLVVLTSIKLPHCLYIP